MNDASQRLDVPWWLSPFGPMVGLPFPAGRFDRESPIESRPTMEASDSGRPGSTLPIQSVDQERGLLGSLNASAHRGLLGPLTEPVGRFGAAGPWGDAPTRLGAGQPITEPVSKPQSSSIWKTTTFNSNAIGMSGRDVEPSSFVQTLSDVTPDNLLDARRRLCGWWTS